MAIRALDLITVTGNTDEFSAAARVLLRSGCFCPESPSSADAERGTDEFGGDAVLSRLEGAYPETVPDGGPLLPESAAPFAGEEAERFSDRLDAIKERDERLAAQIADLEERERTLSHFSRADLDVSELSRMSFTVFRTGCMPSASFARLAAEDTDGKMIVVRCDEEDGFTWCAVFAPNRYEERVDRLLSELRFEKIDLPADVSSTAERCVILREKIADLGREREKNRAAADAFVRTEGESVAATVRTLRESARLDEMRRCASFGDGEFTVRGYVPRDRSADMKKALSAAGKFSVRSEKPDPSSGSPPVLLKNPRIFSPFSFFVEMFGTPAYGEVDPTPFVAITYIILFGVMFGDVGQGLCVSLVGLFMWRLKKMQLGRILMRCGVSSAVFGLIYGSVFGFEHALDPLYRGLFGLDGKPIEVMAPATAGTIVYGAVGVGVALVLAAMLINCFVCARRRDLGGLLFGPNGIPGVVFYGATVGGLAGTLLFGKSPFSAPYIIFLIALPLVLIYLREPLTALVTRSGEKTEWGNYLAQSFFELFESVLSYVTNTMSFLRVGAFVLVHAGMMTVVFTLANMASGVAWWIIVAVGNVVVTAIEGLLVGIQVLRLEFYEMFSRFFEGGGRPFVPIGRGDGEKNK